MSLRLKPFLLLLFWPFLNLFPSLLPVPFLFSFFFFFLFFLDWGITYGCRFDFSISELESGGASIIMNACCCLFSGSNLGKPVPTYLPNYLPIDLVEWAVFLLPGKGCLTYWIASSMGSFLIFLGNLGPWSLTYYWTKKERKNLNDQCLLLSFFFWE